MPKLKEENVLLSFEKVHGNLYQYPNFSYTNIDTKIEIFCSKHGSFFQTPYHHIHRKQGCPVCGAEAPQRKNKEFMKTTEQFIAEARSVHGNKYDYSKSNYTGAFKNI